ncbi:MAG: HU family DNA-binding protein [Anaerolineae bacterium]|nr:HU family DNA-binding protein [Anaerolineae bacterium]
MTLTKKTMIREIGRRTRLKNRDVQRMLKTLIEVWTEELIEGSGRIELEGLFVIETQQVDRASALDISDQAKRHVTSGVFGCEPVIACGSSCGLRLTNPVHTRFGITAHDKSVHVGEEPDNAGVVLA